MSSTPSTPAQPVARFPKQAVVLVHGMGEQIPMDTITGFAKAVWEKDSGLWDRNEKPWPWEVWSKPDVLTGSLELRRITTRESNKTDSFPDRVRTDFFELYWADLSGGSTLAAVENWIFGLLWRNPCTAVPPQLRWVWALFVLISLMILYLAGAGAASNLSIAGFRPYGWIIWFGPWFGPLIAALVALGASRYLPPYLGRVVRYTRATPDNVAARKDIRDRGLGLLNALHAADYERIVVVGHSLGAILAYDLITYFWAFRFASHTFAVGSPEFQLLKSIEKSAAALQAEPQNPTSFKQFHDDRQALAKSLRKRAKGAGGSAAGDPRWLITDLVTVGSPLTHAEFLLTSRSSPFADRKTSRQYPTAPPVRELLDPNDIKHAKEAGLVEESADSAALMSFRVESGWQLHHAAPFAVIKWTNIYDPPHPLWRGDVVSGPAAPFFGSAIIDINLETLRDGSPSDHFTHLDYWSLAKTGLKTPLALQQLREALNLIGQYENV